MPASPSLVAPDRRAGSRLPIERATHPAGVSLSCEVPPVAEPTVAGLHVWPVNLEIHQLVARRMAELVEKSEKPRSRIAAARILLAADRDNGGLPFEIRQIVVKNMAELVESFDVPSIQIAAARVLLACCAANRKRQADAAREANQKAGKLKPLAVTQELASAADQSGGPSGGSNLAKKSNARPETRRRIPLPAASREFCENASPIEIWERNRSLFINRQPALHPANR